MTVIRLSLPGFFVVMIVTPELLVPAEPGLLNRFAIPPG
jgi:hypothetical protein